MQKSFSKYSYTFLAIMLVWGTLFADIKLKYAKKFTLDRDGEAWVLKVYEPYKGSSEVLETRLIPKGSASKKGSVNEIEIPIQSVVSLSTVNLPQIVSLGKQDSIVGVDTFKYINTEAVVSKIDKGELVEVGAFQNLDVEKVLELNPDLVLTYTLGTSKYDTHDRLNKVGIKHLILANYLESTPLGRAEWIKLLGLLFGEYDRAEQIFDGIEKRYLRLRTLTQAIKDKPSVFCNAPFGDIWYVPGGKSFQAQLLRDAGANYLWNDNPEAGGVPLDFEKVFEKAHQADVWLVSSHTAWSDYDQVLKSDVRYKHFKAYQDKNIFTNGKRVNKDGGNDIFEAGTMNPDLILRDFIKIFHPHLIEEEFYFHLALE